ncbi:MAG: PAS domain S-box protein, partial [Oscillochloris sp.]|nr:PAS domain S-box protein [Oscillochloris sp.]
HLSSLGDFAEQVLTAGGVQSLLLIPLHGAGSWWGILRASSNQPDQTWDPAMLDFLRSAADIIAVSIRQWEASRTLREREHFIQRVAHATPDMLYVYDLRTQQLIYTNMASLPSGRTPGQLLGLDQEEGALLADERAMRTSYAHDLAAAADQEVCNLEYRVQALDGRMIWLLRRDTIFARDPVGVPTQILGVIQDITERQQRAEALLLAKDEAEAANRAKSTFLSMMSHELRTPLTAIIGYSQLLEQLMAIGDYRTVASDLHHIYTAGKHLLALINDVLDLSRIEAGKLQIDVTPIWLPELIRDVVSTVSPLVERNQNTLQIAESAEISTMRSDATKVRQVLLNLLNNAAKFTEQGTISISVSQAEIGGAPWISFRIADSGIGIDKHHLPKLFTPFSQIDESLNRRYGGTGLGLALSQRLCQLLGGEITVESELGKGSVFTVCLPLQLPNSPDLLLDIMPATRQVTVDATSPPAEATGGPGEAIILVIDDNQAAGSVINRMLGTERAHIIHAANAQRGLELARDVLPELILIDTLLPPLPDGKLIQDVLKIDPDLAAIPTILLNIDDLPSEEYAFSPLAHQLRHLISTGSLSVARETVTQTLSR